ncbi:MAG: glycosyl transferase, group 1 [Alkalinema sp. RU_4_3]|nr:glycosyl transferase, group 1 [Alkalinema sp. RU_4_3]
MSQRAAFTIITANYLAHAETLAETLGQHNPGIQLYVLIVDPPDDFEPQQCPRFKLVYLRELGEADLIEQMSFYYSPAEFCWSLRGFMHEYMQNHTAYDTWLFLDSDMMVSGSFEPIFAQLDHCSILLNPHFQKTGYLPVGSWIELEVLRAGKFNGGFLGLRRSPTTAQFIAWFKARLDRFAFDDPGFEGVRFLHGDQLWLDFVPIHFPEVELLRHPGANLAHWNLFERDVVLHLDGTVTVDSQPLLFTHFSGWSIDEPEWVSCHSPHYSQPPNIPAWEKMVENTAIAAQ